VSACLTRRANAWRTICAALLVLAGAAASAAPAAAQSTPDADLRARVEAAIASAADVPSDSITVQVRAGVVTLAGSVACDGCGGNSTPGGSATVQQSLGAVVRAVPGVEQVEFRLRYGPD
jgi:osmotically-inducible protein OsmY